MNIPVMKVSACGVTSSNVLGR